ncbi:MAG TPA: DUF4382 domain-containing protein [Terriglobia bacterium]|nr:DUF4382 domain-containing protein [Terriglobia bacterium]
MRTRLAIYGLTLVSLAGLAVLFSCSGGGSPSLSSTTQPTSLGSAVVFTGDTPVCDVVSFTVTITGATLTPQDSGSPVAVVSSSSPVTVDFACLMDFTVPLSFTSVPTGTYTNATLTLSNPQLVVLAGSPLAPTPLTTTLTYSTATATIKPGLMVSSNGTAGLNLDFDLRRSVQTNSSGQATGSVTPTFYATPSTPSRNTGLGEIEQLSGVVQSVSTTSTNSAFNGSFTIQTSDGSILTINTTATTRFDSWAGVNNLGELATGTVVTIFAYVDTNGNIVALGVEVEEQANQNENWSAFQGMVTSVTQNASGAVTQFNLFVRAELPYQSGTVPLRSVLTVNVSSSTWFRIEAFMRNEWGLPFSATTMGVGQEVTVNGELQTGPPVALSASSVFLREQSVVGNFTQQVGSNGNFFTFAPCSAVFNGQSITAVVFQDSSFVSVNGLVDLTAGTPILVRGLLLYEPAVVSGTGGVSLGPGWVMEAAEVHQLNQ